MFPDSPEHVTPLTQVCPVSCATTVRRVPTDGCPKCLARGNRARAASVKDHTLTCGYTCANCGHDWNTNWLVTAL